jgi:hypothetical protein
MRKSHRSRTWRHALLTALAALTVAATLLMHVSAAGAQDDGNYPPGSTPTTSVVREPPPTDVSPTTTDLPFTGGQVAVLVVVGLVAVVIGVAFVRASRRRPADVS